MSKTITRRAALTGSAAGAAAIVAGTGPAVAAANRPTCYDELHHLDALTAGLPDSVRIMVLLNHVKSFPEADRRKLVAQFREIDSKLADMTAEHLGVSA